MRGADIDLEEMLGPDPRADAVEVLVDDAPVKPKSRPMGAASRAELGRSRSITIIPRKNTPERLKQILKCATEMPVANSICLRAGISATTLKLWLLRSKEGTPGDGFDIVPDGPNDEQIPVRFHEAFDTAIEGGLQLVEQAGMQRAIGYREVLTFQGRVVYQKDWRLVELGFEGEAAYLRDEFGAPVPESVMKQSEDLIMFLMERRLEKYKKNASVDVNVRGGVLVVGMRAATSEALNVLEEQYRREGRGAVTFEEGDEDTQ